jgi:hypothetical protein
MGTKLKSCDAEEGERGSKERREWMEGRQSGSPSWSVTNLVVDGKARFS